MKGVNTLLNVFSFMKKLFTMNFLINLFVILLVNIQTVIAGDCTLEMMCATCDTVNIACLDCHPGYILDSKFHCQSVSWPNRCEKVDMVSSDSPLDWAHTESTWSKNKDWSKVRWECDQCEVGYMGNIGYKHYKDEIRVKNCKKADGDLICSGTKLETNCDVCRETRYDRKANQGEYLECVLCKKNYKRDFSQGPDGLPATCVKVESFLSDPVANDNSSNFGRIRPSGAPETEGGETQENFPGVGSWGGECFCPLMPDGENWVGSDGDTKNEKRYAGAYNNDEGKVACFGGIVRNFKKYYDPKWSYKMTVKHKLKKLKF